MMPHLRQVLADLHSAMKQAHGGLHSLALKWDRESEKLPEHLKAQKIAMPDYLTDQEFFLNCPQCRGVRSIERLQAIVAKLPCINELNKDKTAVTQTCPVYPGMQVWVVCIDGVIREADIGAVARGGQPGSWNIRGWGCSAWIPVEYLANSYGAAVVLLNAREAAEAGR